MRNTYTLVMAGGRGTRLWPKSTTKIPKQYIRFKGEDSLLTKTLKRVKSLSRLENIKIVTTKDQVEEAKKHTLDGMSLPFILEPMARNTAPCIFLSMIELLKQGAKDDDIVMVTPSDHVILNEKGFCETLETAKEKAQNSDHIVIIGIPPYFPHTGYGYIDYGKGEKGVFSVNAFKEKPDQKTAVQYLQEGHYLWNSGMFVGSIKTFIDHFFLLCPTYKKNFDDLKQATENDLGPLYEKLEATSFDYAIMEKTHKVSVVKSKFDWNDLGSWQAFEELNHEGGENIFLEDRSHFIKDAKGNIVSCKDEFVALIGVHDLVIVKNENHLLIMDKSRSQEVRDVVSYLDNC